MIKIFRFIVFASFWILCISACSKSVKESSSVIPTANAVDTYPALTKNVENVPAYPIDDHVMGATKGPIPDPQNDSAVIVGYLLENGQPVVNATIYLAEVQEQGGFAVGSYSRSSSPRAETDIKGQFVFSNIEPGKYGLIFDSFATYFALYVPGGPEENALMFDAEAGQLVELGKLDYQDLPEP